MMSDSNEDRQTVPCRALSQLTCLSRCSQTGLQLRSSISNFAPIASSCFHFLLFPIFSGQIRVNPAIRTVCIVNRAKKRH